MERSLRPMSSNFAVLDASRSDVAMLVAAMVQARDAVDRRSRSHPREPTSEAWWADVLADPRSRRRERRTGMEAKATTIVPACGRDARHRSRRV
jgi:hypothetical protein